MHEAQAEGGVLDRAGDDVRDGVLVAQDLDRRLQPLGLEAAGVGRQGAAHLEIGAGAEHQHGQHRGRPAALPSPAVEADERPHRLSRRCTSRMAARSASRSGAARRVSGSAKADIFERIAGELQRAAAAVGHLDQHVARGDLRMGDRLLDVVDRPARHAGLAERPRSSGPWLALEHRFDRVLELACDASAAARWSCSRGWWPGPRARAHRTS